MKAVDWKDLRLIIRGINRPGRLAGVDRELLQSVLARLDVPLEMQQEDVGSAAIRGLASYWRDNYLPPKMDPAFKTEWNIFLALEVGYFYPFRAGKRLPGNPERIGVLLSDRDYLAMVIAEDDTSNSERYLGSEYDSFWAEIVPSEATLPYSTVRTRIERGLELLARDLNKEDGLQMGASLLAEKEDAAPAENGIVTLGEARTETGLTHFLNSILPAAPRIIPHEWNVLADRVLHMKRALLCGQTGVGKTSFLAVLVSKLRRAGMVPLPLSLPQYAPFAQDHDAIRFLAQERNVGGACAQVGMETDLERELADVESEGRLVVLADSWDELLDSERPIITNRLEKLRRFVLASRAVTQLPVADMTAVFLFAAGKVDQRRILIDAGISEEDADWLTNELESWNFGGNLDMLMFACKRPRKHCDAADLLTSLEEWVEKRVRKARQDPRRPVNCVFAVKLLQQLSLVRLDIVDPPGLDCLSFSDRIAHALVPATSGSGVPAAAKEEFRLLERAGVLSRGIKGYEFMDQGLPTIMAAWKLINTNP